MALSLTVTPEPSAERPRVRLDVVGTAVAPVPVVALTSLVTLWRTHADGRRYRVITEVDARLSAGVGVWYDYHCPFGQQVNYSVAIGDVEISGTDATGYWNYAPTPNVLPSSVASLGRAGAPTDNGWREIGGSISRIGVWMLVSDPTITNLLARSIRFPTRIAPGATYDFRLTLKNEASGSYTPLVVLAFYDAAGAYVAARNVSTGASYAAGNETTLAITSIVMPAGAASMEISIAGSWLAAPALLTVKAIMMAPGGSSATFPAPVFIPAVATDATLSVTESWLLSATQPDLSVQVDAIMDAGDLQRPSNSAQFQIIGRRNPIDVSSGQRGGYSGTVVIRSDSEEMDAAILACLESDAPVILNAEPGHERDFPWMWISVKSVAIQNPAEWTDYTYRRLALAFVEVDQPEVSTGALWTWADLEATYATWSAATANYATWLDMQTDTRIA